MELTENTAAKWEWVRDETAKLASSIASKQEIIKSVSSTLDKLIADLDTELETFERLSTLADKEVLREESGTLNDETTTISEPEQKSKQTTPDAKKPTKSSPRKSNEKKQDKPSTKNRQKEKDESKKNNTKPNTPSEQTELGIKAAEDDQLNRQENQK